MLALLLTDPKPESRDVDCESAPSVLDSSSESWCLSSKLGTALMVEFMRFGIRVFEDEVGGAGTVLPLTMVLAVVVRDIAELIAPSETGVRDGRCEAWSWTDREALLGGCLTGVVTGVGSVDRVVTGE
jgi:hypothetical protein